MPKFLLVFGMFLFAAGLGFWYRRRFHRCAGDAGWYELMRRGKALGLSGDSLFEFMIEASPRLDPAFKTVSGVYTDLDWLCETAEPEELVRFGMTAIQEALPFWEESAPRRIRYADRGIGMRHDISRSVVRTTLGRLANSPEKWGKTPLAPADLIELCTAHDEADVDFELEPAAVLHAALALSEFAADFNRRKRFDDVLDFLGGIFPQSDDYETFFTRVFQRCAEQKQERKQQQTP